MSSRPERSVVERSQINRSIIMSLRFLRYAYPPSVDSLRSKWHKTVKYRDVALLRLFLHKYIKHVIPERLPAAILSGISIVDQSFIFGREKYIDPRSMLRLWLCHGEQSRDEGSIHDSVFCDMNRSFGFSAFAKASADSLKMTSLVVFYLFLWIINYYDFSQKTSEKYLAITMRDQFRYN